MIATIRQQQFQVEIGRKFPPVYVKGLWESHLLIENPSRHYLPGEVITTPFEAVDEHGEMWLVAAALVTVVFPNGVYEAVAYGPCTRKIAAVKGDAPHIVEGKP